MRAATGKTAKSAAILLAILSLTILAAPVSAEGWHDGGWYQGCSTLLTDSQREYCVETTECGGVSVLIECIVLIAS
jgi:hypothetical protein